MTSKLLTQATPDIVGEVLIFSLQGERFAVEAGMVHEILDPVPVADVPNARSFVDGLINVRGRVVPLADLRLKFGMKVTPPTVDTRFIVLDIDFAGEPLMVAVIADKVLEVTDGSRLVVGNTPPVGMKWRPDFVRGVGQLDGVFVIFPALTTIFESE